MTAIAPVYAVRVAWEGDEPRYIAWNGITRAANPRLWATRAGATQAALKYSDRTSRACRVVEFRLEEVE